MGHLDDAAQKVQQDGDPVAFRQIVRETSGPLLRLGARLMGNFADGEDVVQECFVRAHRALMAGQFGGKASVLTWLRSILTNAAIDALRSRNRRRAGAARDGDAAWDGVATAEARIALRELEQWWGVLPAEQRVALTLSALEGLPTSEIAQITHSSEGAVEQRLVRARNTLRKTRN